MVPAKVLVREGPENVKLGLQKTGMRWAGREGTGMDVTEDSHLLMGGRCES